MANSKVYPNIVNLGRLGAQHREWPTPSLSSDASFFSDQAPVDINYLYLRNTFELQVNRLIVL